jgi:Ala-tRNA(Pro) deacylase
MTGMRSVTAKQDCLNLLDKLAIKYELVEHGAVYTIEEAGAEPALKGRTEIKNLFIQDDKGKRQYLVMMPGHKKLDLKKLAGELDEKKLRFCSPEKLMNMMGVEPGSVSLFCCLNPNSHHIKVVFDEELLDLEELGMHPIVNTATVFMKPENIHKILEQLPQKNKIQTA